jgi:hypothetical protein
MEFIQQQMFNIKREDTSKSVGAGAFRTTGISFGLGRGSLVIDLKKVEQINTIMPTILKQKKPLDSLVLQL